MLSRLFSVYVLHIERGFIMTKLQNILQDLLRNGKLTFAESATLLAGLHTLNTTIKADQYNCDPMHMDITEIFGTQIKEGLESLNSEVHLNSEV